MRLKKKRTRVINLVEKTQNKILFCMEQFFLYSEGLPYFGYIHENEVRNLDHVLCYTKNSD